MNTELTTKKILLFCDWYEPGFKAGGPIRSCVNFANQMKEDYQVFVFTTDRDLGSTEPYPSVTTDSWYDLNENIKINYCSPEKLSWKYIRQQVKEIDPDFIYLNSMYSRFFTIYPLLQYSLGERKCKLILAPRGMLRNTALHYKKNKKEIFLKLFKLMKLHRLLHFHATDEVEYNEIQTIFGKHVMVSMIPNFPGYIPPYSASIPKQEGELKMIFIGRLHPIKNLDFILRLLPGIEGNLQLTVVGIEEDLEYTRQCKELVNSYPGRIVVSFKGALPNEKLPALISQHHLFVLPTRGENFGHAIFESLRMGRPVLISDQTPWRGLQAQSAGWDLSLDDSGAFKNVIRILVNAGQKEYDRFSESAWQFVQRYVTSSNLKSDYHKLFS